MRTSRSRRRNVGEGRPDPVDVHVGKRVRLARLEAGLSQDELGRGIGVSFQAVQKYERGENRLSASRLYRTAQLVKQPISYFFQGLGHERRAIDAAVFQSEEIALVRQYRRIASKEVRARLLRLAQHVGDTPGRT